MGRRVVKHVFRNVEGFVDRVEEEHLDDDGPETNLSEQGERDRLIAALTRRIDGLATQLLSVERQLHESKERGDANLAAFMETHGRIVGELAEIERERLALAQEASTGLTLSESPAGLSPGESFLGRQLYWARIYEAGRRGRTDSASTRAYVPSTRARRGNYSY